MTHQRKERQPFKALAFGEDQTASWPCQQTPPPPCSHLAAGALEVLVQSPDDVVPSRRLAPGKQHRDPNRRVGLTAVDAAVAAAVAAAAAASAVHRVRRRGRSLGGHLPKYTTRHNKTRTSYLRNSATPIAATTTGRKHTSKTCQQQ